MGKRTKYYSARKEALASKISDNVPVYSKPKDDGSGIVIRTSKKDAWVATLYDYPVKTAEVQDSTGTAEAGEVWTRMVYSDNKGEFTTKQGDRARHARKAISEYEVEL